MSRRRHLTLPLARFMSAAALAASLFSYSDRVHAADPTSTAPPIPATNTSTLTDGAITLAPRKGSSLDESVTLEAGNSIRRGVRYLLERQRADGSWSGHAGITAACLMALQRVAPGDATIQEPVTRALRYVELQARPDGSFSGPEKGDEVYATSMCLMALATQGQPGHGDLVGRARSFLERSRQPAGPSYGGEGFRYGNSRYPDLSNTQWAVEALYVSQPKRTPETRATRRLVDAAVSFISSCQVTGGKDAGAFAYYPPSASIVSPHDKELKGERVWGSLTYGALKTLVYGKVGFRDARVTRAVYWARTHYTVTENPGLENNGGYYYYIYQVATTHAVLDQEFNHPTWRKQLITALLSRQIGAGQWQNTNPIWMESDANLCTAYALLGMGIALDAD